MAASSGMDGKIGVVRSEDGAWKPLRVMGRVVRDCPAGAAGLGSAGSLSDRRVAIAQCTMAIAASVSHWATATT